MKKIFIYILLGLTITLGITFLIITLLNSKSNINQLQVILNATIILVILVLTGLLILTENTNSALSKTILIFSSLYFTFNILLNVNIVTLPTNTVMKSFTGSSIDEVIKFTNNNNIKVEQIYENSDFIPKYHIISQDIAPSTFLEDVNILTVVVSDGPSYDKEVIVPNMIGLDVEVVTKYINDNFLNNIKVEYIVSDSTRNTVIEQSRNGAMKRSDEIKWVFSLGSIDELVPTSIDDLSNMSLFEATLWLEQRGFKYDINYEFSNEIQKNNVISNSNIGEELDPKTNKVTLVVSKGKEIVVPDILNMSTTDITKWVIDNKLNITFNDKYDDKIEINKVITASVKNGDIIEEGTLISITTSKGPLKMEEFNSLNDFRTWANKYNVKYVEKYDYNDNIPSGNIVSFSKDVEEIIENDEEIIVNVSLGSAVIIPNFTNKSKSDIISTCNSIGLKCSFYYAGYSNVSKDVALRQNKSAGLKVVKNSTISIGLSRGPAKTFNVTIQETWLGSNATSTINSLKAKLRDAAPGVTFYFEQKASNSLPSGMIHESSPTKGGNGSFKQGNSYTIWVVS